MPPAPSMNWPPISMPVNFEAEQAVLGKIMMRNRAYTEVADLLQEWHFADETHRKIYAVVKSMIEKGQLANPVTIKTAFAQDDGLQAFGGPEYLLHLCGEAPYLSVSDYARSIVECAYRREIIGAAIDAIGEAETGTMRPEEIGAALISAVGRIEGPSGGFVDLDTTIDGVLAALGPDGNKGVFPTGMRRLDNVLAGGLYAGKFYGISARHKVGKTGFLLSVSYGLMFGTEKPVPHVYIAGEMDPTEIGQRLLARHIGINSLAFLELQVRGSAYVNGEWMTRDGLTAKVSAVRQEFSARGLAFLKRPRLTLDELKAAIARAAMSGKYTGVIVDYLQMVTGQRRGQTQAEHLDDVAQTCVEAAKRHGLWVLAAAQLNRDGFVRGGDGLMNACDMALVLNRKSDGNGGLLDEAWLEMSASRYTPYRHLGTEDAPGLKINTRVGPHFEELP